MTPNETPFWQSMDQAALDAGLNNVQAVPAALEIVAGWEHRSADLRRANPQYLDMRYGPKPRNRLDVFKIASAAPTLVFIHGGYWQTRAKENFSHLAAGPMAHGINVAMLGYTLAPDATLDEIVGEIHAGIDGIVAHATEWDLDVSRLVVAGWSAGGHMTAMALGHRHAKAGLAISGIYDLEPIRHSYLNVKLQLDEAMSHRNSPLMRNDGAMKPLSLICGDAELPLLRQQSAQFAGHRAGLGLPVTYEEIAGANHFSILDELERADGRATTLIRQLFERVA
jgi:acetyl esterase/lipase